MDLEQLNKHQLLLLTLLVSFVTSIATGIVTVSLMNQAPPSVTRVINQIVERTVETATGQGAAVGSATTVVVRDDDLTAQSIAAVQQAVVRIAKRGEDTLIARGVIIDDKGVALSDRTALAAAGNNVFDAILPSGERVPAVLRSTPAEGPLAVLDVVVGTSTGFKPASLGAASNLKLGQTVIRIGGQGSDSVGVGVIASLSAPEPGAEPTSIETSVESATPGSVLITIFGEVVGIKTGASAASGLNVYTTARTEGIL